MIFFGDDKEWVMVASRMVNMVENTGRSNFPYIPGLCVVSRAVFINVEERRKEGQAGCGALPALKVNKE
jgi:hypothetical protein